MSIIISKASLLANSSRPVKCQCSPAKRVFYLKWATICPAGLHRAKALLMWTNVVTVGGCADMCTWRGSTRRKRRVIRGLIEQNSLRWFSPNEIRM